jgi:hypothetical protein
MRVLIVEDDIRAELERIYSFSPTVKQINT